MKYSVLVVDDEHDQRRALIEHVDWASADFEVIGEAENGVEALELLEILEPDLILTDIKILEHEDDEPYFSDAKQEIIPAIIENQSVDVDGVSGATFSSEGIIEAVKDALMSSEEQD